MIGYIDSRREENLSNGNPEKKFNLETMTLEELWLLHESISGMLSAWIKAKARELEKRLSILIRRRLDRSKPS